MAFREVTMLEIKEVLRRWLGGEAKKRISRQRRCSGRSCAGDRMVYDERVRWFLAVALLALGLAGCTLASGGLAPGDGEPPDGTHDGEARGDVHPDAEVPDDAGRDREDGGGIDGDADAPDEAAPDADAPDDAPVDEVAIEVDAADDVAPDVDVAEDAPADEAVAEDVVEVACPGDCSGHGTCTAGVCACAPGHEPPACDHCTAGWVGYPACVPCGAAGQPCCDGGGCGAGLECVVGTCGVACPADMVRIGAGTVCIDRYEASRSGSVAISAAGATPWASITRWDSEPACLAAGKRMCTAAEWQAACQGPSVTAYPYGAAFVAGACNDRNGTSCPRDGSRVLATGSLATCEGGYPGIFDMSGNVWEWVWDTSGGQCGLRGGSVDSCRDATMLSCANVAWQDCDLRWPGLGFRCCLPL